MTFRQWATVALAAATASVLMTVPGRAAPVAPGIPVPVHIGPAPAATRAAPDGTAAMLAALRRDLKLTAKQAKARLAAEARAARTEAALRTRLGAAFAGAWLPAGAAGLQVAVSDAAQAGTVRAAGARPVVVRRSARDLAEVKARLDRAAARAPTGVSAWYVDPASNTVVIQARPAAVGAVQAFMTDNRIQPGAVRIVASKASYRPLSEILGGDGYTTPTVGCSIGFAVQGGYVTAGHCGTAGTSVKGNDGRAQGTFSGSAFPGDDLAWVSTNSDWVGRGAVNNYAGAGATVPVRGSEEAVIGASVCRSGATTKWRCGTITAKNQTIRFDEGTVFGLTSTTACGEAGDSGGSFISGLQAQGVLSGGSGNCTVGGTTVFQPVNEILERFNLTLLTNDYVLTNAASFAEFPTIPTGALLTVFTTAPVTDETQSFPFPWADATPGGLTVSSDICPQPLKILYVGPTPFGGTQINLYHPNTYQGGRNVEPFTCDSGGFRRITVHPKAGFGPDLFRELPFVGIRPGIFMAPGNVPAGYHLNVTTGATTLLTDCEADTTGRLCPVATTKLSTGVTQQNYLVLFTTGLELFGCADPAIPCTPPASQLKVTFSLAPPGIGEGDFVEQDLTFIGWAGFLGQEQANVRIVEGTPPGHKRLRLQVSFPLQGTGQQPQLQLGAADTVP